MLEVYCFGSSSLGNCYVLQFSDGTEDRKHQIMLEAGLQWADIIKKATENGIQLSKTEACLVTHCHKDHCLSANRLKQMGIPVFASIPTLTDKAVRIPPCEYLALHDWEPKEIVKDITVVPFLVNHDAPEPMGFIIHAYGENTLFVNDCSYVPRDLSGIDIDYAMVECNYYDQNLHISMETYRRNGDLEMLKHMIRVQKYHMGLSGLIGTKKDNYTKGLLNNVGLKNCKGIMLMHLSDTNSNEPKMKKAVQEKFPDIPVMVFGKYGGIKQ